MAKDKKEVKTAVKKQGSDAVGLTYCLGLIGAAIYYVKLADGFGEILVALLKALVWPAYFVYEVLTYISA